MNFSVISLRQIIFVVITLSLFSFLSFYKMTHASEQIVHVYGDAGYEPYSYGDTFIHQGLYTEILKKIFKKMSPEYRVQIKMLPWKRALDAVKSGDVFALFPPYYNPEKRPWMDYSAPIFTEKVYAYCKTQQGKYPEDYAGKTIVINSGFVFPQSFYNTLKSYNLIIRESKDNLQGLQYINRNIADCYANDKLAIEYFRKKMPSDLYEKIELFRAETFLGFSKENINKFPYAYNFIEKFNKNLEEMKKNGEINEIITDYLKGNHD